MRFPLLLSCMLASYVVKAKTFKKCELADLLETKHNMTKDDVMTWVCIAQYESTFNTSAINHFNYDGSQDYGLFQLSNKYWCDDEYGKNQCSTACDMFLDDDITDDLKCIRKIIRDTEKWKGKGTGLTAWVAYVNKCQNRDLEYYMSECWDTTINSNIINRVKTEVVISDSKNTIIPIPVSRIPITPMLYNYHLIGNGINPVLLDYRFPPLLKSSGPVLYPNSHKAGAIPKPELHVVNDDAVKKSDRLITPADTVLLRKIL